ncbi:MAG TPA: hypothetical protein VKP30_04855, partial [Polyangiaceae bacterium]|nr:hypothetical protein [Polyangiaceae bacterium]
SRRGAYVIVPVGRWLSASTYENFGPGNSTELIVLKDVLKIDAEGFGVHWAPREKPDTESGVSGDLTEDLITRVLYDNTGRRGLAFAEYKRLIDQTLAYDLFVDMTEAGGSGGYRAGRRHPDGRHEELTLTPSEAAVVVELILAGRALRIGEIRSVLSNDISKIIERGRRKIDIPIGRFEWRMIHTLKASSREAKAYLFRPPEGARWAVVLPNSGVRYTIGGR